MYNVGKTVINMIDEGYCLAVKVIGNCSSLFILIFSHCSFLACIEINFSFPVILLYVHLLLFSLCTFLAFLYTRFFSLRIFIHILSSVEVFPSFNRLWQYVH